MADPIVRVDAGDLAALQRALRRFDPELARAFRARLRDIAKVVAGEAKGRAGWSRRIPAAIRPFVESRGAGVLVSAKRAPHGPLYEDVRHRGSFRHPLFGNRRHWYSQRTRPFLQPAVEAKRGFIRREAEAAIEEAKREVRL